MRVLHAIIVSAMALSGLTVAAPAQAPQSFRDCADCPEMVWVPAGSFAMGASSAVEERHGMPPKMGGGAQPVHQVTFAQRFAIGKYPVTRAQFRAFVQATGYQTGNACATFQRIDGHTVYEIARGYSWRDPGIPQMDDHPVICVNWDDAMAYAAWLSQKTGQVYSLPNEAQYEYAARGGTSTDFFWGNERDEQACRYANEPDLDHAATVGIPAIPRYVFPCHDGHAYTSPVGSFLPNAYGLYDMLGNIWEWTEDCWNPNYQGAPTDGSAWMTGDCDAHSSRGGSYSNTAFSAYLGIRSPRDGDFRGHSFGFRIARSG